MSITTTRSNLLQEEIDDDLNIKPFSYYRRGNLLSNTTESFRQKCKRGFTRSRTSSYSSLDDEQKNKFLIEQQPVESHSFFSTKKRTENIDMHTSPLDNGSKYSRQNMRKRSTSWTSSVLKAVGVKSK